MQYLRLADAKARLDQNLIQIDNEPFYVEYVEDGPNNSMVAHGFKLSEKKSAQIILNQQYIPPPKFQLGYTNVWRQKEPTAVYLERTSRRHTMLGINRSNSFVMLAKGNMNEEARRPDWSQVFLGQPFLDLQNNVFPSVKTAMSFNSCALSHEYALVRASLKVHTILYLNEAIGELYHSDMSVVLYPPFLYAKEELERFFKSKGEKVNVTVHE